MTTEIPSSDPIEVFREWLRVAESNGTPQPDSMALATSSLDGTPSCRIVLFKDVFEGGLVFYTNYLSRKAEELEANPRASAVFHWLSPDRSFHRQVRFEGRAQRVPAPLSDAYWKIRPRDRQISGSVSKQSQVVDREHLEKKYEAFAKKHDGKEIPRPADWGGYVLKPVKAEFWIGSEKRFHRRVLFTKNSAGNWSQQDLSP